jgi:hypothetical protein
MAKPSYFISSSHLQKLHLLASCSKLLLSEMNHIFQLRAAPQPEFTFQNCMPLEQLEQLQEEVGKQFNLYCLD